MTTYDQFTKRTIVDKRYRTNSAKDAHGIVMHILGKKKHISKYIQVVTWKDTKRKEETIQNMSLARPNGGAPPPPPPYGDNW